MTYVHAFVLALIMEMAMCRLLLFKLWSRNTTHSGLQYRGVYPTSDNYKTLTYSKAKSYQILNKTGRQVRQRMNYKSARFQQHSSKFQPYTVLLTTLVRCGILSHTHKSSDPHCISQSFSTYTLFATPG